MPGIGNALDSMSFNNSLAIQNIGTYSLQNNMLIISSGKSRNIGGNSFKTSGSIGSNKGGNSTTSANNPNVKLMSGGAVEGNHMLLAGGQTFYAGANQSSA